MMAARDAEQALVASDPALPGLELLLDNTQLLAALRTLAPLASARSVQVRYLRYKPGTSCVLALEITMENAELVRYFARGLTRERFAVSLRHPKRQAMIATGHPYAPLVLERQAILLLHPSQDRDIRYLDLLWDDTKRHRLLQDWLPELVNSEGVNWQLMRYKPGRRCVAVIQRGETPLALVRCAAAREFGAILQGCATGVALGHITLSGARAASRMVAIRWTPGQSLDSLPEGDDMMALVERVGAELGLVHNAPFVPTLRRKLQDDLNALWREWEAIRTLLPGEAERFEHCATQIEAHLGQFSTPPVVLHGDFSADQVVITPSGPRFIDWDRSASGHPLNDIASFLARLEMDVINGLRSRSQADTVGEALLRGYRTQRTPGDGLSWFVARSLLCLATESFRLRWPDWPKRVDMLLTRVEQLCSQTPDGSGGSDPWQEVLTRLCSRQTMESVLTQGLAPDCAWRLQAARIVRHKPGRRALIEYQLDDATGVTQVLLGKYREKGIDNHAFTCQQALWQGGIRVPEPLVKLPQQKIWLQRKVVATTLTRMLSISQVLPETAGAVGIALARMQQHPGLRQAIGDRRWDLTDELRVLDWGFRQVAEQRPDWHRRLNRLFNRCEALASTLVASGEACLHRDFYSDQILVAPDDPQCVTLLDFDLCALGARALDAGNYLAHISELALRLSGDIQALQAHESAFTHAWLACSDDVTLAEVQAFKALSLARHIFLSTRFPSRAHTTVPLLDYCERVMDDQ